eukprot:TRINITY_DN163_c0_g1_i2.p1 TRINITY_DN163_c0_g1~~TRINITY_DN163_c0_g1_i2.p1  ORF type:complete len:949 (-),score=88.15 TRINITY_DN163_c0_g1_i2:709-3555(-)
MCSASIGQDAMDRFLNTLLSAFYSATTMTEDTKHAFFSWFHALDRVIVTEGLYAGKTCDEADYVLEWGTGSKVTTVIDTVPLRGYILVQWTWIDDNPHSLSLTSFNASDGFAYTYAYGEDFSYPYFNGFGGGRSIISRTTKCTPGNRYDDTYDIQTLVPCVLGLSYYCSSNPNNTCTLRDLANGVCTEECNNQDCLFDGGDCSCPVDVNGLSQCPCLGNQTRAAPDGSCCFGDAVGLSLRFPFSIQTYGTNYLESDAPFLPSGPTTLKRTVANQNVALIGLLIYTERGANINCSSEARFKDLVTNVTCQGGESDDAWGIASPYIKGTRLYNSSLEVDPPAKAPSGFSVAIVTDPNNSTKSYGKNFIVDISLNLKEATNLVQYILDGYFYDGQTTSSKVELITYNAIEEYFTLTKVKLTFQTGGKVAAACSVNTVKVGLYRQARDWIRFALEILFGAALLWTIFKEIVQFLKSEKLAYFQDIWSYMDVISDAIMAAGVGMWIYHVVGQANDFQAHVKYNIYRTLPGDFFQLLTPADGDYKSTSELGEALKVFKNVDDMISLNKIYFSLQGINCFLMVLRVLKFMNFQPRMGVITRTLAKAANSLFHFLILISVMFLGYALFGYIAFGQYLEQFRSIPVALNTLLNAVNGDDTPDFFFVQLTSWLYVTAYLYWWSFIILVFYCTFNVLIAIIVDAHTAVSQAEADAPSLPTEMGKIVFYVFMRIFRPPYRTLSALEEQLKALCKYDEINTKKEAIGRAYSHKYNRGKVKVAIEFAKRQQIKERRTERVVIEVPQDLNTYSKELSDALVDTILPPKAMKYESSKNAAKKDGEKGTSDDLKAELVILESHLQDMIAHSQFKEAKIGVKLENKIAQLEARSQENAKRIAEDLERKIGQLEGALDRKMIARSQDNAAKIAESLESRIGQLEGALDRKMELVESSLIEILGMLNR